MMAHCRKRQFFYVGNHSGGVWLTQVFNNDYRSPILPGAIYNSLTAFGVGTPVPDGFIV